MNHNLIIRATNRIAFYTAIALVYWLFIFILVTVFDLKVFREKVTASFFLSIFGIFSILGASIFLNIMVNLSKISSALEKDNMPELSHPNKKIFWGVVLSIPVIIIGLFVGDYYSAQKKKNMLISSAEAMIAENQNELAVLAKYQFGMEYIREAAKILSVMEKIDKNFPDVKIIVPDVIGNKKVFLSFRGTLYSSDKVSEEKQEYIYSATKEDRAYIEQVYSGKESSYLFKYKEGNYELYFPTEVKGKMILLYFSDYQRYGKFGS